jgi:hypothetical protein
MWCHTELAVAKELRKRIYSLDLAGGLAADPVIDSVQGIKFSTSLGAGTSRLVEALRLDGLAGVSSARWARDRPPYPGLAAMSTDDAGVFFGRDEDVQGLMLRVSRLGQQEGDLVVVIGPSGAGKSSLVRAGLVTQLAAQASDWAVVEPFEPGGPKSTRTG